MTIRESLDADAQQEDIERKALATQFLATRQNFMSIPQPPVNFLVEKMLPAGQVMLLAGTSAGGKTSVTTTIAAAVSTGTLCFGRKTRKTPVIVIDNENPIGTTQRRFSRLCPDLPPDNILWWGDFPGYPEPPKRLDTPLLLDIIDAMEAPPLIIVDSFVTMLPNGADENSSNDCQELIKTARRLTKHGVTVLFIHHTGKVEMAATRKTALEHKIDVHASRGSSAIGGAVDMFYFLDSHVKKNIVEWIVLTCAKLRDDGPDYKINLDCQPPSGILAEVPVETASETPTDDPAAMPEQLAAFIDMLKKESGSNKAHLKEVAASVLGMGRKKFDAYFQHLTDRLRIEIGPGKSQKIYWDGKE